MEELFDTLEGTSIPAIKTCDNALIVQNRLLKLVKLANDRVMELQQAEDSRLLVV
jgi:hypothetical protein